VKPNPSTAKSLLAEIRRVVHLARIKGIRKTAGVAFESYVFSYRQYYLSYTPVAGVPSTAEEAAFHCRLATMNDVERLTVFESYRRQSEFREWLSSGSWVFIALDGELPVAFNVASTDDFVQPPFSRIPLRNHQIWGVDLYTLPSYRRRGAARAVADYKFRFLAEKGFKEYVTFTRADNKAATAMSTKRAGREFCRLTYLRILFFSRIWLESETGPDEPCEFERSKENNEAGTRNS
jgi:hypothetical protein